MARLRNKNRYTRETEWGGSMTDLINDIITYEQTKLRQRERIADLTAFLRDMVDPDRFGHAVSAEVRQKAMKLLENGG